MLVVALGVFVSLHGLVHLLYFAQARRLVELRPDLDWPDGSWAFAKLLGGEATRRLASVAFVVAAVSLAIAGAALTLGQGWWLPAVVGAAVLSALLITLFWDGTRQRARDQGEIGLLIDVAILAGVLVLGWPAAGS